MSSHDTLAEYLRAHHADDLHDVLAAVREVYGVDITITDPVVESLVIERDSAGHVVNTNTELRPLAHQLNTLEFDQPFTLYPCGSVTTDTHLVHLPTVTNDPDGDVEVDDPDWEPLTGMTAQHGYDVAVMHPSEYIGPSIARHLLDREDHYPVTYVITTVIDTSTPENESVGWCICALADR